MLGTQTVASTAASFPSTHSATTTQAPAPQSSGKQAVPCIFFQKGLCLKGDRCAFLHGPTPSVNKTPLLAANAPVNESPPAKKTPGVLQKCTQEQKVPQANVSKAIAVPPQVYKPAPKTETALPRNGLDIQRDAPLPPAAIDEFPRYKVTGTTSVVNGGSLSRPNRQVYATENLGIQTGKETDEYLRESSPGFDVLVDDDLGESEYYHGEGMNINSNEYDVGGSVDFDSVGDIGRDVTRDPRGYDSYDRMQGQYGWEKHRVVERKGGYPRADSPDRIAESDLRYRLSKNRRGNNGLRSVVSLDYASEKLDERSHRSSRRDSHNVSSHESSLSGRLRGRIKLPSRPSVSSNDIRAERESDRGRNRGQLSPNNAENSHQGNLRDRIKGRTDDDYNNFRGSRIRRETMDDRNFAGPKSLAELKSGKNAENKEQQILGKRKTAEYNQQYESDLAFEGPMPLSEILKRKREAREGASNSKTSANNQREFSNNNRAATTSVQSAVISVAKDGEANNEEQQKPTKAEEKNESLQLPNGSEHEGEDGIIGDETMDHELDADDQREGDYEYEQDGDDGEYNYEEEGEGEGEEEYADDEDGDDFAKKIGVMFS